MAQITYTDKVALNVNSDIPDINKVNASDMNEIKQVVNENETAMNEMIVNTQSNSQTSAYSCDYVNGTVLYENQSGTQSNFTLSDNISNYSKIDIVAKHWYFNIQKVFTFYDVNSQSLNLDMTVGDNGTMYFTTSTITISGTSATIGNSYATNTYGWSQATSFASAFGTISQDNNARFKIFKVIGYK